MEEQLPSGLGFGEDAPASPKRKKVRAKYASRACVACRRSKLKCSGANPCRRCEDNGRRCFYSEDQTAAEALQHLSRPAPAQPSSLNGHSSSASRRNILPRDDVIDRRASDGNLGSVSMEARMARIEGMMEALVQERGIVLTPRGSIDREGSGGESFRTDANIFSANPEPLSNNMFELPDTCPESRLMQSLSTPAAEPSSATIRIAEHNLAFPNSEDYRRYITLFFEDIHSFHFCINEAEFRLRSERIFGLPVIPDGESSFVALNYAIFACVDALIDTTPPCAQRRLPGLNWWQIGDALVGKRKFSGRGDLSLIQFLLLGTIFLTCTDKPNSAYTLIGLACRLCFQFGLHQQTRDQSCSVHERIIRRRVFWTAYVTDRRISLSCGRPYSIRDLDIDLEDLEWLRENTYSQGEAVDSPASLSTVFLLTMVSWAKVAGEAWDRYLVPSQYGHKSFPKETHARQQELTSIDDQILQWTTKSVCTNPLLAPHEPLEKLQRKRHTLINTLSKSLRLLLRRFVMPNSYWVDFRGRSSAHFCVSIIETLRLHAAEAKTPSTFRFTMTISLISALSNLSFLLVNQDFGPIAKAELEDFTDAFKHGVTMLTDLASTFALARRVADDLRDVIAVTTSVVNGGPPDMLPSNTENLHPYRSLDFAGQEGALEMTGSGSWNGEINMGEAWDFEMLPNGCLYGCPWI